MKVFKGVQADILNSVKRSQLVSAGAGSGKTTIMIEKIADLILSGKTDIDSLLVVTFTVLAAGEMKERLITRFTEEMKILDEVRKEQLSDLIEKIKTASIDTIDGFSSKTIKKYFYELEISPNIEIISDATRDYFLSVAVNSTLDSFKNSDKLNIMMDLFAGNRRNLDVIQELLLSTYNNIVNIKDYEKFLDQSLQEYKDPINSERIINLHIASRVENLIRKIKYSYSDFDANVKQKLDTLIDNLKEINPVLSLVTNFKTLMGISEVRFSLKEKKENVGLDDIVFEIKEFFEFQKDMQEKLIDENYLEFNEKIIKYFEIYIEILKKFIKNYNKLKEKNNLIDFNDLNRLMLKLLDNEKICNELKEKFKYIFVDEYQDVNPLQDELVSRLVGENTTLFTVGDVKQSIYGFRGASPEWFLNKYNGLKTKNEQGEAFDMNCNFRSSPKILEFINETFSNLMTVSTSDINYKQDALIEPMRTDIIDDDVKMMFVISDKNDEVANGVYSVKNHKEINKQDEKFLESKLVLKIITELIGTQFYDANLKQTRMLTYKDISILTRSDKDEASQTLINMLKDNNVPLNVTNKLRIDECEVVKLVMSILKCVANIADDVDYLASFMCLTDLDIDDIVSFRDKEKSLYENLVDNIENEYVKQGFDCIEKIKKNSYVLSNKELINSILNEQKLKYFILRKENGEKELELLEKFLENLTPLENNLSLYEFINVIETSAGKNGQVESFDCEDSVTIQTIHKSKGLEYPVVILFNSSKMFSYIREHEYISFNSDIGLGVDFYNTETRQKNEGVVKTAIKIKNAEKGYKEEMRLLYVALTRAKNKLFITGNISSKQRTEQQFKHTNYSNMLLSCFKGRIDQDENKLKNCTISFIDDIEDFDKICENETVDCEEKMLGFDYGNKKAFSIPFKNTVTGLNSKKSEQEKFSTKAWLTKSIQYQSEEDKALIGTHYHKALEELDLKNEYVQTTNFEDVNYKKIKKSHEILSKIAKNAIKIKKEAEFMMYLPYNELVASDVDDKVLVQGVVDLLMEFTDGFVIVDYKFSSLPISVLKQKYAEQLNLYKIAVEKAYKKPVKDVLIYSINTGELL